MQERHTTRRLYFDQLAATCEKYFIPYIDSVAHINWSTARVLEIGCGEGGTLLPPARRGSSVVGVDMDASVIDMARNRFAREGVTGQFIASDIFKLKEMLHSFNLIFLHDVIEHIDDKRGFLATARHFLAPGGIIFVSFPAWQMPFGGHRHAARSRVVSHTPFLHLLPRFLYKYVMQLAGESIETIAYLIDVKETGTTIEQFRQVAHEAGYSIAGEQLYLIGPLYDARFGLRPRRLWRPIAAIPWLRNFFSSSCIFILTDNKAAQ